MCLLAVSCSFFFFKQKTAYEMRISDWSSDVCSSDLLVITEFGLPKVIGGQFNMLAVDIYKQVIGQQNFEMGAVVSVVLLIPAIFAFTVDRFVQKRQEIGRASCRERVWQDV